MSSYSEKTHDKKKSNTLFVELKTSNKDLARILSLVTNQMSYIIYIHHMSLLCFCFFNQLYASLMQRSLKLAIAFIFKPPTVRF